MAGRLSFSIAINLLTENFKKGTNNVKNGFRSMQMQVLTFAAALGVGGLGLSDFVSRLITVARETSRVTTALKNVSGSLGQFADNQRFLLDMAKKYGLEINALTGNFAKFTAASQVSGMSMMNQRKIFESVSRAATAFGMSAEDSNGVFLALSQMMSKGKISSEELRLQMGERLPIALQAMAEAAGVSVAELDKLMKQGKIMSKDVLPGFADALNRMIPNVDTDNLETSINRLKNAFTKFTKETGIQNAYKGIIDWLTGKVTIAGEDIKKVFSSVAAFVVGVSLGKMFKWIVAQLAASQRAAMIAASRSAKAAGVAFDAVAWKAQSAGATVSTMFTRLGASMKSAFISALPTAILVFLSMAAAKLISMRQEAARIKNLFSDYKAEANQSTQTAEIIALNTQLKLMNEKGASQEQINNAQAELQKQLGKEYKSQEDLNKAVAKRVELLKAGAEVDFYTRKKLETEDQISNLQRKKGKSAASVVQTGGMYNPWNGPVGIKTLWSAFNPFNGAKVETDAASAELTELQRILSDVNSKLETSTSSANALGSTNTNLGSGDGDTKKTDLQKAEEKYAQSLRELDAKAEIEKISKNEYNKALDELNASMFIDAKGSGDKAILESKYFKNLQEAVKHPLYNKNIAELEDVQKKHKEEESKLLNLYQNKRLTEQEYNDELRKLTQETIKAAGSISGLESQAYVSAMQFRANSMKPNMPVMKKRDTTYDYKKSKSDIAGEELDIAKDYAKKLQEQAKEAGKALSEELANAMANVPTLEKALKIAVVMEDVKQLKEELNDGLYSGVKDIASSADRLVSSFQALNEAFDPESEASGWERLMAVWSVLTNVVDSMLSVSKMLENLSEISNKLTMARDAETLAIGKNITAKTTEAAVDTLVTNTKVSNTGTKVAADNASALSSTASAGTEVAANTAKGVSAAGASAAALPFPANLIAIGGAIAAAVAMFAAIPKFANGGIISGGPTSGDKILARVNAGEMILNSGQQSKLWQAIQSGRILTGASGSSSLTTRVRGRDLVLLINNELKSSGKKPL